MAVVNLKSGSITNRDAVPITHSAGNLAAGNIKVMVGTIAAASGDSIASTYNFGELPSNAVVHKVELSCDAITSGAGDIGIYQNTKNGNTVVDADHFASAQSIASALENSDVTHESGVYGIEDVEKELWEALGLSEDSDRTYDVVMTLTAATTAAGDVTLRVWYTTNQ